MKILKKALKKKEIEFNPKQLESLVEIPPSTEMGDFAFPCFSFSKQLKMSPQEIAINIRQEISYGPRLLEDR